MQDMTMLWNAILTLAVGAFLWWIRGTNNDIAKLRDDLKEHGYKTGELIGKKLKSLEEEWVKNNFIMKKKELEKLIIKNNKN